MKKILSTSVIILSLSLFLTPYAFCQDTKKVKPKTEKETNKDDTNNEADVQKDAKSAKRESPPKARSPIVFGIEGGLNMAILHPHNYTYPYTTAYKAGARAGILLDIRLSSQFYLQPGLFYAMNGVSASYNDGFINSEKVKINTIELPFNVLYKSGDNRTGRFFCGAGLYLAYNISGTDNNSNPDLTSGKLDIGSNDTDKIKAVDWGLGINLGYQLPSGLFFRGRYQAGLANISPVTKSSGASLFTSSYGIQIGYLFGKKPRHNVVKGKDNTWE